MKYSTEGRYWRPSMVYLNSPVAEFKMKISKERCPFSGVDLNLNQDTLQMTCKHTCECGRTFIVRKRVVPMGRGMAGSWVKARLPRHNLPL